MLDMFGSQNFLLVSPKNIEEWPKPIRGTKYAASSLKMDQHFTSQPLPPVDRGMFCGFLESLQTPADLAEYTLHVAITSCCADIAKCSSFIAGMRMNQT